MSDSDRLVWSGDRQHGEPARMRSFQLRSYAAHAYRHAAHVVYTALRSAHSESPTHHQSGSYYSNRRHRQPARGQPACGQRV